MIEGKDSKWDCANKKDEKLKTNVGNMHKNKL